MIEAIIIFLLYRGFSLMSLNKKSFNSLTPLDMEKLDKNYANAYRKYIKKGEEPPLTKELFLSKLQKQGKTSLIIGLIIIPFYVLLIIFYYISLTI